MVFALCVPARGQDAAADPVAAALQAQRLALQPQLRASVFGEPLVLSSRDGGDHVEGDVYAEVRLPLAAVEAPFRSAATVCELLSLHLNVHGCRPGSSAGGDTVALTVGPKRANDAGSMYGMTYALRVDGATASRLRVTLTAAQGPLSTRDYRILIEAVPIDAERSFLHIGYTYGYGTMAKLAMSLYLATAGRSKIGFTVTERDGDGKPVYLRGERASLERNVIRYHLAVLAYGSVAPGTPGAVEARQRAWFALTEKYAAQLHELDLDEYLQEKRDDITRAASAGR
jgi:hypothetical protein